MCFDGRFGDDQGGRDFVVAKSGSDEPEDLPLSFGEGFDSRIVLTVSGCGESEDSALHVGIEDALAVAGGLDGSVDRVSAGVFGEVSEGSGLHRG